MVNEQCGMRQSAGVARCAFRLLAQLPLTLTFPLKADAMIGIFWFNSPIQKMHMHVDACHAPGQQKMQPAGRTILAASSTSGGPSKNQRLLHGLGTLQILLKLETQGDSSWLGYPADTQVSKRRLQVLGFELVSGVPKKAPRVCCIGVTNALGASASAQM